MAELSSTSPVSSASSPTALDSTPSRQAPRMATMLDLLLVLAAVLVSTFRWSPIQSIPSIIILVAIVLLCLLLEEIVRVVNVTSEWLFLPLGMILFLVMLLLISEKRAQSRRISVEDWFGLPAALATCVAIETAGEPFNLWHFGLPWPLGLVGFHQFLDGGIEISAVVLLLVLAWIPMRKGQSWSFKAQLWALAAGLMAALPAAIVGGWAWSLAATHQRWYAAHHPFALLLAIFWVLTALLMVVEWVLLRHASTVGTAPEETHNHA